MSYAEKTSVAPEKSEAEIKILMRRYGASDFISGTVSGEVVIAFKAKDRLVRFRVKMPLPTEKRFTHHKDGWSRYNERQAVERYEQEIRRRSYPVSVQEEVPAFTGRYAFRCHPDRHYYVAGQCRPCYQKGWAKTNAGKASKKKRQRAWLASKRASGLLVHGRLTIPPHVSAQTECQVCGSTDRLVVDHEHGHTYARGRLCDSCNRALGFVEMAMRRGLLEKMVLYASGDHS